MAAFFAFFKGKWITPSFLLRGLRSAGLHLRMIVCICGYKIYLLRLFACVNKDKYNICIRIQGVLNVSERLAFFI